jgi:predicted RNase H-like nuclease
MPGSTKFSRFNLTECQSVKTEFVAGVDGCKAGWVWFKLYDSGRTEAELVSLVEVLQRRTEGLKALAIDIPIGLLTVKGGRTIATG